MNITVIGTGNMGSALVKQFARAGHKVTVTARNSEKAASLAAAFVGVTASSPEVAAVEADIVVVATSFGDA